MSWRPPNLAGTELGGCAAFRAWSYRLEMEDMGSGEVITKRGLQGNRVSLNKSDQLQPATLYKVSSASSFLLHNLLNIQVRVVAYSEGGEGPWSRPWTGRSLAGTDKSPDFGQRLNRY